jgi:anti-anti-sigma regulatory factor
MPGVIDSSGLAALAFARRRPRACRSDLLLAAPQPQVLRLLTLTRLAEAFSVYASVQNSSRSTGQQARRAGSAARAAPVVHAMP